jgi:hypothetical protein
MQLANLALRFFLEIAALCGFGVLAWGLFSGWWRYLAVVVVLGTLMAAWAVFAVPGDPQAVRAMRQSLYLDCCGLCLNSQFFWVALMLTTTVDTNSLQLH